MGSDKTRQQQLINLRTDFENLKMKESETIKQYSDRIMAIVKNIRLLGDDFSESRVVENVITILPEKFESKISSLEDLKDLSAISLSELVNSLYALDQRRANRQKEHPEGAFQAKAKESSSSSYKGKKPWLDKREKSKRDFGHVEKVCKNKRKVQGQQQMQAKAAEDLQAQEERVFSASYYATSNKISKNWLVDSGCSHHMASDERLFKNLDRRFTSKFRVGNSNLIKAKGKWDAVISTQSGSKVISDILYVPDIDQNLISVGQLIEKGYSLVFKNNSCVVEDSFGQVLVTVAMTDRCFMLDINQLEKKAYTSATDLASLWHKRLGHVSYKSLGLLNRLNLVEDMSKINVSNDVCEVCQLAFSKFKALVENQSGCKIKALRLDNGAEYLSKKFQKLCEQVGIHHQLTTVYIPQQNGVCERKNRTVLDMARSCLPLLSRTTPFEVWHDLKPTVSHLKVFGCVCYTLIPVEKRTKLDKRSMPGIFVGYSSTNKSYRSDADASLSEENQLDSSLEPAEEGPVDEDFDEEPVRGTRTIADIYQRCNVAIVEPSNFEEATKNKSWKKAMEAELDMIHKNDTWELVDRPDQKKVIGVKWKQWRIHQLDVKSAFLNGFLKEEIFIERPEWFKVHGEEDKVYKLKKAFYGLKLGFEKNVSEPTLFIKKSENETLLIVSLYVDDLLVTGSKEELINEFNVQMQEVFEMMDLGILNRFGMFNCKIVNTLVAQGEKLTSCGNQERVDEKEYQSLVAEAEYIAAAAAVNQAIWLRKLL
ncbi:hypothetical protein CXB51_028202 [Gossypium anomalum]|uniref:Integrase catalytic domain-containing protein n=1 Tax=Gossypium anomalum TaxID=47600 RepID=A0A8J5Y627_9ROSI|nr:hypothetical protein CXB51_028202 [Gossypium anomalum]